MSKYKQVDDELNEELLELPDDFLERLICKQLVEPNNSENTLFVHQHFRSGWFKDDGLKLLYKILYNFYEKQSSLPTKELLYKIFEHERYYTDKGKLTTALNNICTIDETVYDDKFLQRSMIEFTKRKSNV